MASLSPQATRSRVGQYQPGSIAAQGASHAGGVRRRDESPEDFRLRMDSRQSAAPTAIAPGGTRQDNIIAARMDGTFDAKRNTFNAGNTNVEMDAAGNIGPRAIAPVSQSPAQPSPSLPVSPPVSQTPPPPSVVNNSPIGPVNGDGNPLPPLGGKMPAVTPVQNSPIGPTRPDPAAGLFNQPRAVTPVTPPVTPQVTPQSVTPSVTPPTYTGTAGQAHAAFKAAEIMNSPETLKLNADIAANQAKQYWAKLEAEDAARVGQKTPPPAPSAVAPGSPSPQTAPPQAPAPSVTPPKPGFIAQRAAVKSRWHHSKATEAAGMLKNSIATGLQNVSNVAKPALMAPIKAIAPIALSRATKNPNGLFARMIAPTAAPIGARLGATKPRAGMPPSFALGR